MRIDVTQDDINNGRPRTSQHCPIARAIKRQLNCSNIAVGPTEIEIGSDSYKTPDEAYFFIRLFDRHFNVKPFSFELNLNNKVSPKEDTQDIGVLVEA